MNLTIDKKDALPLYRQIVRQIREMILSAQLPAGFHLPPERRLAEALGVTRTTVINAYDALKSEGLVDARVGHGTVVTAARQPFPEGNIARTVTWPHLFRDEGLRTPDPLVRDLLEAASRPDVITFAIGLPSPDHLPVDMMRDVMERLMHEAGPQLFLQTPTEGSPSLREALGKWLTTRGIVCSMDELLVLSGSQQGLHLAARVFLNPGDTVIIEAPTYFGAMEAFRRAGARLLAVPTDPAGMQVEMLAGLLRHHRPKLIYVQPSFANPSGAVMSVERRRMLLQLAVSYGIPVLEDDTYSELRYDGSSLPSLKSLDPAGLVLSLGTFSKTLFPGLRLGWLAAPRQVIRQFALAKQTEDLHAGTLGQYVLERLVRSGRLDAHIEKMRGIYRERRKRMAAALDANAVDGMTWQTPAGGFYFWCELPRSSDRARLSARAADESVSFLPGYPCFADEPPTSYIRLSFSYPPLESIEEGIKRLMRAVKGSLGQRERAWERPTAATRPIV